MYISRIKLHNYKQFHGTHEFYLSKINFVQGPNGIGKTNFALKSLLFVIFGYNGKDKLQDLPTEGKSKSGYVEVDIKIGKHVFTITRHFPKTEIIIQKDGEDVPFKEENSKDKQQYLIKLFSDVTHFKVFRMVDAYDQEVNFLDKGETTVKKLLFSLFEKKINNIRQRLLDLKTQRDKYNRDRAVIYSCYPSENRLAQLEKGIEELSLKEIEFQAKQEKYQEKKDELVSERDEIAGRRNYIKSQIEKLRNYSSCPFCKRPISDAHKKKVVARQKAQLKEIKESIAELLPSIKKYGKYAAKYERLSEEIEERLSQLQKLILKLEGRLKQKDFKFTDKDVFMVKQAIDKLDNFSTLYLINTIESLEPIMNSVLTKIHHRVKFTISERGKFSMELIDGQGQTWHYYRLSTGQKLIIQIALKLALLLEKQENGIIIADEGLGSLDNQNLHHIISLFQNLPFQLVFILHNFGDLPEDVNIIQIKEDKNVKASKKSNKRTPSKLENQKTAKRVDKNSKKKS